MASSPTSIENQIDSFLEQFKRSASRAMEDTHRSSYNASSSISRSRSGNLDLEVLEAGATNYRKLFEHDSNLKKHHNRKIMMNIVVVEGVAEQELKNISDADIDDLEVDNGELTNQECEPTAEKRDQDSKLISKKSLVKKIKQKKNKVFGEPRYDPTKLEDSPVQVLQRFKHGCECQDDQCFKGLNPETVYRHRLNIAELTKAEHDMYLMGVTMACLTDPHQTARHTERRRLRAQYVYQGRRVCLDAFLYLENCTHYQIKRIRKHLVTHGVTPRVHGNHGKVPHNTFSLDIYQIATEFLKNFVQQQELRQKTKAVKNAPLHLPPEITRKTVHDMYTEYCKELSPNIKIMGYSTFRRFMKVQFPQVKFAKLEFVVRTQQQNVGKADNERRENERLSETTQFVTESGDLLPLVITSNEGQTNNTYFLTPVEKFQEGLSYQLTESGILVNRTGVPLTVANISPV